MVAAGKADEVKVQTTSDAAAKQATGSSNDDVTLDDKDDEVVASRDRAHVTMATADASTSSSSAFYPLSATVELPPEVTSS